MDKRIMLAGVSGIGKTTLARYISEEYDIPFISGSYTSLLKGEQGKNQRSIMELPKDEKIKKEFQLLTLRVKMCNDNPTFVSDRSFLDSATYHVIKLSQYIPKCETEDFIALCYQQMLLKTTHLIYVSYDYDMYNKWEFENNDKRIVNPWFQLLVSNTMNQVIEHWEKSLSVWGGIPFKKAVSSFRSSYMTTIGRGDLSVKLLYLNEIDLDDRKETINYFLNL